MVSLVVHLYQYPMYANKNPRFWRYQNKCQVFHHWVTLQSMCIHFQYLFYKIILYIAIKKEKYNI